MNEDSQILVVEAPRSGTTLTGRILGSDPQINTSGEIHFFENIWTRRMKLGRLEPRIEIGRAVERMLDLYQGYYFPESQSRVDALIIPTQLIMRQWRWVKAMQHPTSVFLVTFPAANSSSVFATNRLSIFFIS